jgi:hypothetical protein
MLDLAAGAEVLAMQHAGLVNMPESAFFGLTPGFDIEADTRLGELNGVTHLGHESLPKRNDLVQIRGCAHADRLRPRYQESADVRSLLRAPKDEHPTTKTNSRFPRHV